MPRKAAAARNITQLVERNSRPRSRWRSTIGRRRPELDEDEREEERGAAHAGGDDGGRRPPLERTLGDAVHQEPEPGAAEHEAGHVEAAGVDRLGPLQEEEPEEHGHDADRHVHEEHPAPREVGDQEAAEHGPDGGRQGGAEGDEAGGPDPLGGREDPVEHGHADRRHHAAARALHDAEQHQLGHVLGQTAQGRADGEDDDRGQEHAFAAEAVAQPTRRRDEDGQAHEIGDHDPVDGGRGDVEVAADGGQRDVHDRDVHDVHEHRRHEHDADGDLLIHAGDGHVLFRLSALRVQRVTGRGQCPHGPVAPSTLCARPVSAGGRRGRRRTGPPPAF